MSRMNALSPSSSRNSRGRDSSRKNAEKPEKTPLFLEVGSLLAVATSIFTLLSLATFESTDPSFLHHASGATSIRNLCGRIGSYCASALLQVFGCGAFLIPAALFFSAVILHRRQGWVSLLKSAGGMCAALLSLAVFLSLQWKYWPYAGTLILTGGLVGYGIAELLARELNSVGASIVSLLVFCIALVSSTPIRMVRVMGKALHALTRFLHRTVPRLGRRGLAFLALSAARMSAAWAQSARDLVSKLRSLGFESASEPQVVANAGAASESPRRNLLAPPEIELESEKEIPSSNDFQPALNLFDEEELKSKPSVNPPALSKAQAPTILPRSTSADSASSKAPAQKTIRPSKVGAWKLPTVEFLRKLPKIESAIDREKLLQNSQILRQKFLDFGIEGEITAVRPGPVITLYEFKPGAGVKVSRIAALADDLSMALSAQSVRILAPLPGKSVVGIEIPSDVRETVYLREFLQHPDFYGSKHMIPIVMGKDIGGQPCLSDLARMPHLLCAGQTGSGKSVFMNGLICSLFYRFTPDELRMILVDPKFIEFRAYQDIPHLLLPVVDDPKQASTALRWAVREMERRYRILAKIGARNLASFNQKVEEMGADVVRDLLFSEENAQDVPSTASGGDWMEAFELDESGAPRVSKLPCIVVIIDELADLMMVAKKEVEISIARIAQKARAAGIHLVIATQRPSTDVITGLIKANLPSRVSFQLASYVDSKTILDRAGAERLLGQGDMLFIPPGVSQSIRLHGAFVDDEEISKITSFLKSQGKPVYRDEILLSDEDEDDDEGESEAQDELFEQAIELVRNSGHASASFLQRHLKVGYNRAARMIETMESRGIVGPADGARPREVLMR